jgi:CspA family cold shock protein
VIDPQAGDCPHDFPFDASSKPEALDDSGGATLCAVQGRCERTDERPVQRHLPHFAPEMGLALGTVKWFDSSRGYGFIAPDNGAKEIFVHMSALNRVGMTTLVEGQRIEYQPVITERGGHERAEKLKAAQQKP